MSVVVLNKKRTDPGRYLRWIPSSHGPVHLVTAHACDHEGFASVTVVDPYVDNPTVEEAVIAIARSSEVSGIIALSESDILRAGRLRSFLGVRGQSVESATAFRDKLVMKQLATQKVDCGAFSVLDSWVDLIRFTDRWGFPVVVKPRLGSGSVGTHKVCSAEDFLRMFPSIPPLMMVERFVSGEMYEIDGFVQDGKLRLFSAASYSSNLLDILQGVDDVVELLEPSGALFRQLQEFGERLLATLPLPPTLSFHGEVFREPDGNLVLCEVASRTGGGRMGTAIREVTGFELDELVCRGNLGEQIIDELVLPRKVAAIYNFAKRPGIVESLASSLEIAGVVEYQSHAKPGDRLGLPKSSSDPLATVVISADTSQSLRPLVAEVAGAFLSQLMIAPTELASNLEAENSQGAKT